MKMPRFLLFTLLLGMWGILTAQSPYQSDTSDYPYWIEMMQDEKVNFYDVVRAFEKYWEGRPITKGCGYKPFKRWEYSMRNGRIFPDGTRKPSNWNWNQWSQYKQKNRSANEGQWISLGPVTYPQLGYKGLGRVNAIAFHPTDPNKIYIGAPSGGMWMSSDNGLSWISHTDSLPTLGVSSIIIDYSNPQIIYIGTGDRDAGDAYGMGVMRSTDGGITWELWNNGMGEKTVGRLIQHPTDPLILLAATSGGIYKTNDGGATWSLKKSGNFKDIVFKPNNPDIIYATSGANFFKSTNGGESFSQITAGLSSGQRAVVAVTPANPNYVYLLVSDNSSGFKGLYRSDDGGASFVTKSTSPNILDWSCDGSGSGGQAWYDLEIAADPQNPNLIFAGGVNVWKSLDGGATWQITGHWYGGCGVQAVHADQHVFEYNPLNNRLYIGNDGGVYSTTNEGQSWTDHTAGLVISQIYKIGQNPSDTTHLIIGMQDNGSSTFINNVWADTRGGDGMECQIDYQNPSYSYASLYYGDIARFYNNSGGYTIAAKGKFGIDEDGDWVTPYALHVTDPTRMFIGYKNIWRGQNILTTPSWAKISDNLAGSNNQNIRVVAQSPADPNILYFARWDRKLFRSDNVVAGQPSWTNLSASLPTVETPSALCPHPTDPNIIYMALNGKIYKSVNKGNTWTDISGTLPNIEYTSIAYYKRAQEGLYVSSDLGVFYTDNSLNDWIPFSKNLPIDASIREIEIVYHPTNNELDRVRAGTYGRGVWSSKVYRTMPQAAFTADATLVPVTGQVKFTDLSTGIPSAWQWTFEGGTPASSSEQNPTVTYNTPGTFAVALKVSNSLGSDSVIYQNYITVSSTILPAVGFYADKPAPCSGQEVHLYDTSLYGPVSWHWQFEPNTVTYTNGTFYTSQNPVVIFNEDREYTVTLTVTNPNGSASITRQNYIHAGGYAFPFNEDFEEGFNTKSWTIENPDYGITWDLSNVTSAQGTPTQAARMNFFNYYRTGERDRLISPPINFTGYNQAILSFKHAYAQRYYQKDSLIIYVSDDCSSTWNRVFASGPDGNGIFETAPKTDQEFFPILPDDWCGEGWGAECIQIDLSAWLGKPNIRIAFESYNKLGNNLFIDDVLIDFSGLGFENKFTTLDLEITPNPSWGIFEIKTNLKTPFLMELISAQGKTILRQNQYNQQFTLNIPKLPKGIYLLRLTDGEQVRQRRLIKQ